MVRRVGSGTGGALRERLLAAAAALAVLASTALLLAGVLGPAPPVADPAVGAETLALGPDVLADVAAYRGPRRAAALGSLGLALAVPTAAWAVMRRPGRSGRRARGDDHGPVRIAAAAAFVLVLLIAVVRTPVAAWAGLVHDGRWGMRTGSAAGWFVDRALVTLGEAVATAVVAALVVWWIRRSPRGWPTRVVLLVALLGPLALLLHPVVVHALLLPTGPLPDGPHREAIRAVAARSDVDVPVLLGEASLRTTRPNAVATGLGPTARVVVHDTLLDLPPERAAAVVAHELAHLERQDPLRAALAPVPVAAAISLLVRRRLAARPSAPGAPEGPLPEPRALVAAVALVLVASTVSTPAVAAFSRAVELRADVRAVAISGDVDAHVALVRTFVEEGLTDPEPPRWSVLLWATHPSPSVRAATVSAGGDASATR